MHDEKKKKKKEQENNQASSLTGCLPDCLFVIFVVDESLARRKSRTRKKTTMFFALYCICSTAASTSTTRTNDKDVVERCRGRGRGRSWVNEKEKRRREKSFFQKPSRWFSIISSTMTNLVVAAAVVGNSSDMFVVSMLDEAVASWRDCNRHCLTMQRCREKNKKKVRSIEKFYQLMLVPKPWASAPPIASDVGHVLLSLNPLHSEKKTNVWKRQMVNVDVLSNLFSPDNDRFDSSINNISSSVCIDQMMMNENLFTHTYTPSSLHPFIDRNQAFSLFWQSSRLCFSLSHTPADSRHL